MTLPGPRDRNITTSAHQDRHGAKGLARSTDLKQQRNCRRAEDGSRLNPARIDSAARFRLFRAPRKRCRHVLEASIDLLHSQFQAGPSTTKTTTTKNDYYHDTNTYYNKNNINTTTSSFGSSGYVEAVTLWSRLRRRLRNHVARARP